MLSDAGFPTSIIRDGPTFRDELERQPQLSLKDGEIESLRLVPAKSAAKGVHAIYFVPEHRQWALVRMAKRYRWIFEIQLNRGMSGERQLLQQGFTVDDLEFLFDIVPAPPAQYNPIVYDMLWLVATYDEYLTLTEEILDRKEFTPANVLESVPGITEDQSGFFTRFHRSHLIRATDDSSQETNSRTESGTDLRIDPEARYAVTEEGTVALAGILNEHERIFESRDLDPLFVNPDRSPERHLEEFTADERTTAPEVSLGELQDDDGVLGEIASSFSGLIDEPEPEGEHRDGQQAERAESNGTQSRDGRTRRGADFAGERTSTETESERSDSDPPRDGTGSERAPEPSAHGLEARPDADGRDVTPADTAGESFGDYSREEVLVATVAAASLIRDRTVVRSQEVKEATWRAIDVSDRDRAELWERVTDVLRAMDSVYGRPQGRIWTAID